LRTSEPDRQTGTGRNGAPGDDGPAATRSGAGTAEPADLTGNGIAKPSTTDAPSDATGADAGAVADPDTGAGVDTAEGSPRLNRRVPLANLAEGLRRGQEPATEQPQLIRDPKQAREALSRFQASQQAARAMLDGIDDSPDDSGGDRHA
jgi:hypothetical protein